MMTLTFHTTLSMLKHIFTKKFSQLLIQRGVSEKSRPYYHRHLTSWGTYLRREKGEMNNALEDGVKPDYSEIFERWTRGLGGNPRMEDFQIRQATDAVLIAHGDALSEPWATADAWAQLLDEVIADRESYAEQMIDGPEHIEDLVKAARLKGIRAECSVLIGRLVSRMRERHYAYRTEVSYREWIERFLLWTGANEKTADQQNLPPEPEESQAQAFLGDLAVRGGVAKSTQKQAVNALSYFFKQVLAVDAPDFSGFIPAKQSQRIPVVLSQSEITRLLGQTSGVTSLMMKLMYGTGMRLMECMRLRVKDVDFENGLIIVREGKGGKDRRTPLPLSLSEELKTQLTTGKKVYDLDREAGVAGVWLPGALAVCLT
jgi:integrase